MVGVNTLEKPVLDKPVPTDTTIYNLTWRDTTGRLLGTMGERGWYDTETLAHNLLRTDETASVEVRLNGIRKLVLIKRIN